jgi:hypothetical protein
VVYLLVAFTINIHGKSQEIQYSDENPVLVFVEWRKPKIPGSITKTEGKNFLKKVTLLQNHIHSVLT